MGREVVALMAAGIRQAWWTAPWWWLYGIAVLTGTVWVYVCLLWMGLASVQVWDTVALIGAFYALFILQQLTQSTPLLHMVLLLPLLAMATAPLQLASVHTSGAFLTVAMLSLGIPWLCSPWAFGRALAERSRCTWASSP